MRNFIKVVYVPLLFLILMFVFSQTEFEPLNQVMNKYIQALIFTISLIAAIIKPESRIKIFYLAFLILFLMVGSYLLQKLALANSLGSIGVGILLITSLTYLPELFNKGYVEKI